MNKNITIVGCGNIGSRHSQGLMKLPFDIIIDVVEPSFRCLKSI